MSSSKNPCISLCKFDDDICIGCGRSKKEIKGWKKMDKDERKVVLADSASRLKDLKKTGRRKKK
ncbi:putative Fe-S protein [Paucimonas lemoignei]|nr:putative Fe-S protein [Paucimonas lemoignei]